jgi:hypothetical protein
LRVNQKKAEPTKAKQKKQRDPRENCQDCILFGGNSEACKTCNYIFIKDKMRPCPPGDECTVKIPKGNPKKNIKKEKKEKKGMVC